MSSMLFNKTLSVQYDLVTCGHSVVQQTFRTESPCIVETLYSMDNLPFPFPTAPGKYHFTLLVICSGLFLILHINGIM